MLYHSWTDRLSRVFICAPLWKLMTVYVFCKHYRNVYIWFDVFLKCFQVMKMYWNGAQTKKHLLPSTQTDSTNFFSGWNGSKYWSFSNMNKRQRAGWYGWNHYHNIKKDIFPYQLWVRWGQTPHRCKTWKTNSASFKIQLLGDINLENRMITWYDHITTVLKSINDNSEFLPSPTEKCSLSRGEPDFNNIKSDWCLLT